MSDSVEGTDGDEDLVEPNGPRSFEVAAWAIRRESEAQLANKELSDEESHAMKKTREVRQLRRRRTDLRLMWLSRKRRDGP